MPEYLHNRPEIEALETLKSVLKTHSLDFAEQDVFTLINKIESVKTRLSEGEFFQQAELDKLTEEVYKFINPDKQIN